MKITILFVLISLFAISCSKDDENGNETDIIGKWDLIEVLADPGDGSGTFQPVTSDKFLEFKVDGSVTSNSSLCSMSLETNTLRTGTYSLQDSTIVPDNCSGQWNYSFAIEGDILIISYPCIEPCGEKYKKQ